MILNIFCAAMGLLCLALLGAVAAHAAPVPASRERALMGTTCRAEMVAPDDEAAAAAASASLDEIARVESVLSTWDPTAEMSRANAQARRGTATISRELATALAFALDQSRRTNGAFDPSVGALEDAWDLRGRGRIPSPRRLREALAATGIAHVRLGLTDLALDAPAAWIDTGGFGKGLALDRAADVARRHGATAGLFDFGGQLLAFGERADVAVADPRDRDAPAVRLTLADASASTSAQSERFVEARGRRFGHVLDPRTGRPVAFDGSATVVAPTGAEADALSTALLVMGPRDGLDFAKRERACAAFLVPSVRGGRRVLELRATDSFLALVTATAPGVLVR